MADETNNLVLDHLRAIGGEIAEVKADLVEIKTRLGHMEGLYGNLSGRSIVWPATSSRSSVALMSSKFS